MNTRQSGFAFVVFGMVQVVIQVDASAQVVVQWDVFPPPVPGDHYTVDDSVEPPNVQLIATELTDGTPVGAWFIGRGTPENPLDLGDITTAWAVLPHDIIVLVGTDQNAPCRTSVPS